MPEITGHAPDPIEGLIKELPVHDLHQVHVQSALTSGL